MVRASVSVAPETLENWSPGDGSAAEARSVSPSTPVKSSSPIPKVIKGTFVNPGHASDIGGTPPSGIVKGRRASLENICVTHPPVVHGGSAGAGQATGAPDVAASKQKGGSVPLADGWEMDVDPRSGRKFYVNHKIRKWSWNPPVPATAAAAAAAVANKERTGTAAPHANGSAPPSPANLEMTKAAADQRSVKFDEKQDLSGSVGIAARNLQAARPAGLEEKMGEGEQATDLGAENTRHGTKAVVLPHHMHSLRAPVPLRSAPPGVGELAVPPPVTPFKEALTAGDGVPSADPKWSRKEHDREVAELKNEIHLIRSQSKDSRGKSKWDTWSDRAQHKDSKINSSAAASPSNSTSQPKSSPLKKVDIAKIRQAPYTGTESNLVPENAGLTYRQVEAAQYGGRGGALTPRTNSSSSAGVPSGFITARGRIETVAHLKASPVGAVHIFSNLPRAAPPPIFAKMGVGTSIVAVADTGDNDARVHEHREWQISPRSKMEMGNKTAEVEELLNTVSCMRDQQTYLLRALKECTAIISSEMTQTQQRWKGYNARHDEAGSARDLVDSEIEEQMEEIDHIQREISQPSIEDLVLITQLHGVVRNLLKSREKHAVQVATLQKHCEHQEQSRLFLNQVHALLSETVKNLESSQGKNHVPWKEVARTHKNDPADESGLEPSTGTAERRRPVADEGSEQGEKLSAEVVRVAAELEDVCMELHWMVGLISKLGEDAMSSPTSEGQHRLLLMQQEQMLGFKETVDVALQKTSNVMARVTSSLFMPCKGIPPEIKEDFEKLTGSEGGPDSRILWHQTRYHRDNSAWVKERDALYAKLAQAQEEMCSLRASIGSQSLEIQEFSASLLAIENAKALQASEHAKAILDLRRALDAEKSITAGKQEKIHELETLLHQERQHSERVVQQAVSTLETLDPEGKMKLWQYQQALGGKTGPSSGQSPNSVEITEHPRYQLHAQLIEQEQKMHTVQHLPSGQRKAPGAPPESVQGSFSSLAQKNTNGASLYGQASKPAEPSANHAKLTGVTSRGFRTNLQGPHANRMMSIQMHPTGSLADAYDDQTSVEEVDSSKFSLVEGWEDTIPIIENASSSSETAYLSSNEGSEHKQSIPKSSAHDQGEEDPFERFRKWHARTSFPRYFLGAGNMNRDWVHAFGDDLRKNESDTVQVRASRDESLTSVSAWDPTKLPIEWQIRGRIIEAYNLPRMHDDTPGSYVCCISLIQDLKGVAYQHYMCLDHSRVLDAHSSEDSKHRGLKPSSPRGKGPKMQIRPQQISRPSTSSIHPVWEEEVRFIDMHPNPVVLERLFAVGQLAVSNERVLLSGLPVHVLVSVENPKSEMRLKGHFLVEPGQAHDIWVDLVDASGKRLVSPNGKGASLLVNLLYEPMHNSLRSLSPSHFLHVPEQQLQSGVKNVVAVDSFKSAATSNHPVMCSLNIGDSQ